MAYKIREARESKGWSQERLAEESQVSRSIISGLESGTVTSTTTGTLLKIARALNRKLSEIFEE